MLVSREIIKDHPDDYRVIIGLLTELSRNICKLHVDPTISIEENILKFIRCFETAILNGIVVLKTLREVLETDPEKPDLLRGTILETTESEKDLWAHYDLNQYLDTEVTIVPPQNDDIDELINKINEKRPSSVEEISEDNEDISNQINIDDRINQLGELIDNTNEFIKSTTANTQQNKRDTAMIELCNEIRTKITLYENEEPKSNGQPKDDSYQFDKEAEEIQADEGDHERPTNNIPVVDADVYKRLMEQNEAELATVLAKIPEECYPMLETKMMARLHGREKRNIIPSFTGVQKSVLYYLYLLKRIQNATQHTNISDTNLLKCVKEKVKQIEHKVSTHVQSLDEDKKATNQTARFIHHLECGTLDLLTVAMVILVDSEEIDSPEMINTLQEPSKTTWKKHGFINHFTERHELHKQFDKISEDVISQCNAYNNDKSTYV